MHMLDDDQPTQPLTDAELAQIKERTAHAVSIDEMDESDADNVYELLAEVDRLRAALTALGRNEQAAANRSLELQDENERLRLELVQIESGAQITMNAGVAALQEVKRLEIVRDDLKLINDRMAEDRLRLIDERDLLIAERETDAGVFRAHRAAFDRLQTERDALVRKLGLDWGPDEFGDLDAVPDIAPACGNSTDWSCKLDPYCACSKNAHDDDRHECACGSWWYSNE